MIQDCVGCGFVGAQYVFTLVNALEYRHIKVEVRGHGFSDRENTGRIWIVDPVSQTLKYGYGLWAFDDGYVTTGVPVSTAYVSTSHRVEAWLNMEQQWGDAYDVKWVKITYQYPVLH